MNRPIRIGAYTVMKDKIISIFLKNKTVEITTTIGKDKLVYDTEEIAFKVYDDLYNQLGTID